ncbi:MAG: hypothetical protein Q9191_005192 [Dirinaria sp. TL-2023a]
MSTATSNLDPCSILATELPGKVSFPNQAAYETSKNSYFFQQARLSPECIVSPSRTAEVALIIKTLNALRSQNVSSPTVAVRGGGHTPFSGAANVDNGVTIDLSHINDVELVNPSDLSASNLVDSPSGTSLPANYSSKSPEAQAQIGKPDTFIVSVGGGANWGDVYTKLQPFNIVPVGGRGLTLGVGGLLTGGSRAEAPSGISFFSPVKGFACDNVVNMEVVLADGSIVNTNAKAHPDLFKALKGGSNNFGIVTRFDLQAYSQGDSWGGFISFPSSTIPQQLSAFSSFMRSTKSDPYGSVICAIGFIGAYQMTVASIGLHYTKAIENPALFQPFTSIQPQLKSTVRIANNLDFVTEVEANQALNSRGIYENTVFHHSDQIINDIYQLWSSTVDAIKAVSGVAYFLIFQRLPLIQTGVNPLGLDDAVHDDPMVVLVLSVTWTEAQDDATVKTVTQALIERIDQATKAAGLFREFKYLNYAAGFQDPIASYGSKNVGFLQAVSREYDPTGFFQRSVPGGFKLFR